MDIDAKRPIIFFDGVCGLCNSTVDCLLRWDKKEVFYFAPLQGDSARKMLPEPAFCEQLTTIVLLDEGKTYYESDAVIQTCRRLGGLWTLLTVLRFFPKVLRDWGYRFISRNRYRWFGKRDECRLPSASEKTRFLS